MKMNPRDPHEWIEEPPVFSPYVTEAPAPPPPKQDPTFPDSLQKQIDDLFKDKK